MDQERITLEARSALRQAWDQRATAFALWSLSIQRRQNAEISASLGADRYQNGSLNALDFRALDVALLLQACAIAEWGGWAGEGASHEPEAAVGRVSNGEDRGEGGGPRPGAGGEGVVGGVGVEPPRKRGVEGGLWGGPGF